ncbi:MAG: permease [Propionibacteriaceae bacterium]|jgi:uncharacterized membrane protein YraQ (UPF0718 family)|nr:permease [Micropruina sp.]HBX81791.1 hypothetical protein [Propionibacteriaceae bacterium]HBY24120.1 hypothetical protein [Propionibacteriaceae bacterium]
MIALADRVTTPKAAWVTVAIGLPAWFALYSLNEPFWAWALGGATATSWGAALQFFCYDSIKVLLLLAGIIFLVAIVRSFTSVERTRALLGGKRAGVGNVLAACLGVVTPFCSCSAVPAFIGFVAAGVPLGVTMSFLIASPLINEIAIALLLGLFGVGPTLLYVGSGLIIASVAGYVIGALKLERFVEPFVYETKLRGKPRDPNAHLTWPDRVAIGLDEVQSIVGKTWPYLLAGIALGAVIHGWAPADFFATVAGRDNPFAVLIAVALGVPLYSNAAGILPVVEALHDKGLPMGTLLAFMMSVVALSLPEMIILRRVLKPRLIATFVGVTAVGIVATGYLFNAIL